MRISRFPLILPPALAWVCAIVLLCTALPAGADYQFVDGGQLRSFSVAQDELFLQWHGAGSPENPGAQIEALGIGAKALKSTYGHALVRLAKPQDEAKLRARTDDFSAAFPGVEVLPVLYEAGQPREQGTRRVIMTQLLAAVPAGQTPADLAALVGAQKAVESGVDGLALLTMGSPYQLTEALLVLQHAGIAANPLLGHFHKIFSLDLPKDQFFPLQWHLHNTGQGGGLAGIDANVLDAWQVSLGDNITIGIVDSCLELTHPDLADNIPPVTSNLHHDFLDQDNDPSPHFGDQHGTSVAGVAAALQNNGAIQDAQTGALLGVTGVSPHSRLLGLRLINESGNVPVTDLDESQALFWKPAANNNQPIIDVSNNSWGPVTPFVGLAGPDVLTLKALQDSTIFGRDGRGQITLFAAGNSFQNGSDANFSGYSNSRYVIAVGAVDNVGIASYYSQAGANVMVSAPSNGGTLGIVTTDITDVGGYNPPFSGTDLPNTDYTNSFGGTSSATPLVSGTVALMLSANSNLGWRDIKEILAGTARQVDGADAGWVSDNSAGFKFHHQYGGGMVDTSAAVIRGLSWDNLGQELSQTVDLASNSLPLVIPDGNPAGASLAFNFSGPNFPNLRVETVEVTLDISHAARSQLNITLTSPSGVTSTLAVGGALPQGNDTDFKYSTFYGPGPGGGWTFTTVHDWGENSTGTWTVTIADIAAGTVGTLNSARVKLYGTASTMDRVNFALPTYAVVAPATDATSPGFVTVNVNRTGPTNDAVQVDYLTSSRGSARAEGPGVSNPDYRPVSGTLNFPAGVTTQPITVPILHDPVSDGDKTIYLLLKNPVGASLGGITLAAIRIIDGNVNIVTVLPTDFQASEPVAGVPADNGSFTIARAFATQFPVAVQFHLSGTATAPTQGGVAQAGGDYDVSGASAPQTDPNNPGGPDIYLATIPANQTSTTITIAPRADGVIEGVETVDLTLDSVASSPQDASYAVGVPATAEVRILDADRPNVQIQVEANRVLQEPSPTALPAQVPVATLRVSRDGSNALALDVDLVFGGNQLPGVDYSAFVLVPDANNNPVEKPLPVTDPSMPVTVTIPAGSSTLDVFVRPLHDPNYQSSKTVTVSLSPNPNYNFGFGFLSTATLTILEFEPLPPVSIPAVAILTPKTGTRIVDPATVTITGTAASKGKGASHVNAIEYSINGAAYTSAAGVPPPAASLAWSISLNLPTQAKPEVIYGPNVLKVRSVDAGGNRSQPAVLNFSYVKERAITFTPSGSGSVVAKKLPKGPLEVGQTYTLTAQPAPGQVFKDWLGLAAVTNDKVDPNRRTITFTVADGAAATLTPEFIVSPFVPALTGNYAGLAQSANFAFNGTGFLNVTLMPTGAFTAKLFLAGVSYSFKGEFNGAGIYSDSIPRKGDLPLLADWTIDLDASSKGTKRISGTIRTPGYTLNLAVDHAGFDKNNPPPNVGGKSFTIKLPPNNPLGNADFDPRGNGYGTMTIDAAGVVKGNGVLGDGTKFMFAQALNVASQFPFFLDLYKHRGVIAGTITADVLQPTTDLSGSYAWVKSPDSKDPFFPLGFQIASSSFQAAIYTPPVNAPVLSTFGNYPDNAAIALVEGNLVNTISKVATVSTSNVLTVDEMKSVSKNEGLKLKIDPKAGTFSGSFTHPITFKSIMVGGVWIQKQQIGVGGFMGSSQSSSDVNLQTGSITITPQ